MNFGAKLRNYLEEKKQNHKKMIKLVEK